MDFFKGPESEADVFAVLEPAAELFEEDFAWTEGAGADFVFGTEGAVFFGTEGAEAVEEVVAVFLEDVVTEGAEAVVEAVAAVLEEVGNFLGPEEEEVDVFAVNLGSWVEPFKTVDRDEEDNEGDDAVFPE